MTRRFTVRTVVVSALCLLVVLSGVAVADVEPNDDRATATPITPGTPVEGSLASGDGDVSDWYVFEVDEPSTVTVTVTQEDDAGHLVRLYRPDGLPVQQFFTERGTSTATTDVTEPGRYYVSAVLGTGDYVLVVDVELVEETASDDAGDGPTGDAGDDEAERGVGVVDSGPDGEFGAVTEMPMGAQMVGRDRVWSAFYRAEATNAQDVVVAEADLSGPDAADFTRSGVAVGQRLSPGETVEFVLTFTPSSPGEKTASLRFVTERGSTVTYRLSGLGVAPDAYEDNEALEDPARVDPGVHRASLAGPGDVDVDAYEIEAGDRVTVSLSNEQAVPLRYFLGAPGPTMLKEIAPVAATSADDYEFVAPRTGTYYVVVGTGRDVDAVDPERFEVEVPYELTIAVEASPATATPSAADRSDLDPATTSTTFPGFGALAALIAVALLALVAARGRVR